MPTRSQPTSYQQPMRVEELDYDLPADRIATEPAQPRDSARLLVMSRTADWIEHRQVRDLPEYLHAGDALVFNNTALIPARLLGRRADTGGKIEGLYLGEELNDDGRKLWRLMLKAGGRLVASVRIDLLDHHDQVSGLSLELVEQDGAEWLAKLEQDVSTDKALNAVGRTPLPPYILKARNERSLRVQDQRDRLWYQTVYAQASRRQSVAAPTAGLHFTPELLSRIDSMGVRRLDVTLHVGQGTFKPVTAATVDQHIMHSEWFEVPVETLAALREIRRTTIERECAGESRGSARVIAVGTTTVRTLESLPEGVLAGDKADPDFCGPITGMTDLLIAPPYRFRHVDGMLTNFHLPRSTLLALVAAMVAGGVGGGGGRGGVGRIKAVYQEAIDRGYRFYSYGDAMLILP